jgi:type VI protein secretion system component Hcp
MGAQGPAGPPGPPGPQGPAGSGGPPAPPPVAPVASLPTGVDGFMNVPGVNGDSRDRNHINWFVLTGLGFSVTQPGGGVATWTFGATVLASDGLPPLLLDSASQKALSSIVFEFDATSGALGSQKFLSITLSNARLASTGTTIAQGDGSVALALSFSFTSIDFVVTELRPDGSTGSSVENSFDLLTNMGGPASTTAVTYGLGNSNPPITEGIAGFTPQTENSAGGKTSFGPASVVIPRFDASALNSVGLAFTGVNLPEAHVLVFSGTPSQARLTYDFGKVLTSSVSVAGLTPTVSFSADDLHWTSIPRNPDGSLGTPVTTGWSVSRNMAE